MNKRFLSGMAALTLVLTGAMAPISASADEEYDLVGNFSVDDGEFVFGGFSDDTADFDEEEVTVDAPAKVSDGEEFTIGDTVEEGDFGFGFGYGYGYGYDAPKKDVPKTDDTKKDETKTDDAKKDTKKTPKIYNPYDYILPDEAVAFDVTKYPLGWYGYGYGFGGFDYAKPVYGFNNTLGYLYGGVDYGKPTLASFGNYFFPGFTKTVKKDVKKKDTKKKKSAKKAKCTKAPVKKAAYIPVYYAPAAAYKTAVSPFNTWCKCFNTITVPKKTGYFGKFFYNTFNFKKLSDPTKIK